MLKLLDNQLILFKEASPIIRKTTCQLFNKDQDGFKPYASGVLLELDSVWYLLTAGHNFDDKEYLWTTSKPNQFIRLGGEIFQNDVANRSQDKLDICIVKLNSATVENLKVTYKPIGKSELGINHLVKELPKYLAFGYPSTKTKSSKYSKRIKISSFEYFTLPAKEEMYEVFNCSSKENIIFNYDKQKVYNYANRSFIVGPDAYGLSGAGVWDVDMGLDIEKINCKIKLVSILTEWPVRNNKFWISTRIDMFTECLRKYYGCRLNASTSIRLL